MLAPNGQAACVLEAGTDSLRDLVTYRTKLGVGFTVLDPPELRGVLRELATRHLAGADAPPPTEPGGAGPE